MKFSKRPYPLPLVGLLTVLTLMSGALASCAGIFRDKALNRVEEIINAAPDSAYQMLQAVDTTLLSEYDRMRYVYLHTRACDKLLGQRGRIAHDYYQEELLGQCLMAKGDLEGSLTHLGTASAMFPCKFYPRYEMYILNKRLGRVEECQRIRQEVRDMPIKIPSPQAEAYRKGILWEDSISIH